MIEAIVLRYIARFGYVGIFGSMMLGMIGLPIPDELLMTFSGYLVYKGELNFWLTLLTASLGAISGVSFSFLLGSRLGLPLLAKYGHRIHLGPDKLARTQVWFARFGKFAVSISYFIPGIRHLTAISAGISHWRYRTFAAYAAPGGVLWAVTFVTMGRFLGERWETFTKAFHQDTVWFVLGAAALAGLWWFWRSRGRERAR